MPNDNNERFLSVREAAKECGRNMETVRRWIWAGKLPAEKLGNQLFIKRADFTTFCTETATLPYDAKNRLDADSRSKHFPEQPYDRISLASIGKETIDTIPKKGEGNLNKYEETVNNTGRDTVPGNRVALIEMMRGLRESIRARTGKVFDAETMIRELRNERDREGK